MFRFWVSASLGLTLSTSAALPLARAQSLTPLQLAQATNPITFLRNIQHGRNVTTIAFSDDGQQLASTGGDSTIRVWNVEAVLQGDEQRFVQRTIAIPASDRYVTSLAFSPDHRYLVTGTFNGDVRIWDLQDCDPERPTCASQIVLERDYSGVAPVVKFSPSGQFLAASNYDGTVTLWRWNTRTIVATLSPESGAHNGDRPDGRFSSLTFSPDETYLAAGSHDTKISVWSLADEFELLTTIATGNGVDSISFSPDGEQLISGNFRGLELRPIQFSRGRLQVDEPEVIEAGSRVNSLFVLPNGQYIFTGDNNNRVMVLDVEEEEWLAAIAPDQQHARPVLAVTLAPTGNLIASGSADGVIKLWRP